ncbi:MAG: hypothetical protein GF364_07805, partial [Candidatus Lokiarchaeota archaeon]|nr:hypothetical protein [Candidatus Lokiarchaeota archaeon]
MEHPIITEESEREIEIHEGEEIETLSPTLSEKPEGVVSGILAFHYGFIFLLIAYLLYTSVDPSYSIQTHFISDLGIGPNGAAVCFTSGILGMCESMLFYHIYEIKWADKLNKYPLILTTVWSGALFYSIGGWIAAIFPVTHKLHTIGAFFYFLGALLYYGAFIVYMLRTKSFTFNHILLYIAIFTGYFTYTEIILYAYFYPEIYNYISIYLFEWITLFIHLLAILIRCIFIIHQKTYFVNIELEKSSNREINRDEKNNTVKGLLKKSQTENQRGKKIGKGNILGSWREEFQATKYNRKTLVIIFIGWGSIILSVYLVAVVIFIDHTFLYRVVLKWVVIPIYKVD